MIDKNKIQTTVEQFLKDTDYELVDITIDADNQIAVEIDSYSGVDIDFCARLNREIENQFDRNIEDYSLEVGSTGLTTPFKTLMQYKKNVGNDVEVLTRDGKKLHGVLVEAEPDHFAIDTEVKVQVEGKKRKETQIHTLAFAYGDVKYAKYDLKI